MVTIATLEGLIPYAVYCDKYFRAINANTDLDRRPHNLTGEMFLSPFTDKKTRAQTG